MNKKFKHEHNSKTVTKPKKQVLYAITRGEDGLIQIHQNCTKAAGAFRFSMELALANILYEDLEKTTNKAERQKVLNDSEFRIERAVIRIAAQHKTEDIRKLIESSVQRIYGHDFWRVLFKDGDVILADAEAAANVVMRDYGGMADIGKPEMLDALKVCMGCYGEDLLRMVKPNVTPSAEELIATARAFNGIKRLYISMKEGTSSKEEKGND